MTLLVFCWKSIFSFFMHTKSSPILNKEVWYEKAWKDIIIRSCIAITLGWGLILLSLILIKKSILIFDLPSKERHFLYFSTIQSAFACLGALLLLFLLYRISFALLLRKKNIHQPVTNALIVGLNVRSLALAENLRNHASGYKLLGFTDALPEDLPEEYAKALDVVCSLQGVEEYIKTHRVDEIFLTLPVRSFYDELKSIIQYSLATGLTVRVLNDFFTFEAGAFNYIDGDLSNFTVDSPTSTPGREEEIQISIKFLADKIISLCALFFVTPLLLTVWVLNSFYWPFSLKEYIGLNKKTFRMVQFKDIQAIVFLKKRGLLNIPQLFNILQGDMSIIGPKPISVQDAHNPDTHQALDPRLFEVKPGLISPYSINKEGSVLPEKNIQMELNYIVHQGAITDYKILKKFIKTNLTRLTCNEPN